MYKALRTVFGAWMAVIIVNIEVSPFGLRVAFGWGSHPGLRAAAFIILNFVAHLLVLFLQLLEIAESDVLHQISGATSSFCSLPGLCSL